MFVFVSVFVYARAFARGKSVVTHSAARRVWLLPRHAAGGGGPRSARQLKKPSA